MDPRSRRRFIGLAVVLLLGMSGVQWWRRPATVPASAIPAPAAGPVRGADIPQAEGPTSPARVSNAVVPAAAAPTPEPNTPATSLPAGMAEALAMAEGDERGQQIEAALREWASRDVAAAGAWARSQMAIPRPLAMAAVIGGATAENPAQAIRYVREVSAADPDHATEYGSFLIIALNQAGQHLHAATWAAEADHANPDWLMTAYSRWAQVQPETALLHAVALPDPARRRTAADAAIAAWARHSPRALAECALNFPAGPERNLAIVSALRAWSATEPENVSSWMMTHRDSIASVPNLSVINED